MSRKNWYVWIFPLIALIICGILVARSFDHGPRITIAFPNAEGIIPGRTPVKFRGVSIGLVEKVDLDEKGIIASVTMDKGYKRYAVEGTRFWLVEPQVTLQGISGLSTLRDGNYIAIDPGDPKNSLSKNFIATPTPRQAAIDGPYNMYVLSTPHLGALGVGDPVYYRGLTIGQVLAVGLNRDATAALIRIGVLGRYTPLIRTSTMFWRKQGVHADLSLFGGSEINIGSLESLLKGGIEAAIMNSRAPRAKFGAQFALQEKAPDPAKIHRNSEAAEENRQTSM